MKKIFLIAILIISSISGFSQVTISTIEKELDTPWEGFGYNQWGFARQNDGVTFRPWDDELWATTQERILAIRPSLVRLPLMRSWFNADDAGNELPVGTYNWDSKFMQAFYKIMDLYKEHDIKVMSGLWHAAFTGFMEDEFYASDDFARLQGDLIEYLIKVKGYGNIITCYAPTNEPLGCMSSYDLWKRMCVKLYAELGKRGLPQNIILGADSWGDWIWKPAQENRNELSGYDFHNYLNDTPDDTYNALYNRTIEPTFENNIKNIRKYDVANKPVHVSEIAPIGVPFIDWPVATAPAHCRIDTYEYAVGFMDYGIQLARSGMSSGLAWGLDGFDQNKNAGMWNNAGTYGGMSLRPWYYTWQLMCRYIPRGAKMLKMSELADGRKDVRIVGARIGVDDYSFAIVNRRNDANSKSQKITLKVPATNKTFYIYEFNRNSCGNGIDLTLPYKTIAVNNMLQDGVSIEIPLESCVFVTSLSPLSENQKEAVSDLNIIFEGNQNYSLHNQIKYGATASVITNPRKREPNLSEKVCQISIDKSESVIENIDDAHGIIVPDNPVMITKEKHFLKFQTYRNGTTTSSVALKISGVDVIQGYTFETQSRVWQEQGFDLSAFVGKNIEYIACFPDRNFNKSTNTNTYLSIDNIRLDASASDAISIKPIEFSNIDKSIARKLNVGFENLSSDIALSSNSDVVKYEIVGNPKSQTDNDSQRCFKVTMYSTNTNEGVDDAKIYLNTYPNVLITDDAKHLFFQSYRNTILTRCAIEITLSSEKLVYTFDVSDRRLWTTFGVDLSHYVGAKIENIAVYPNVDYRINNLGLYDDSYYDNFVLNNNPISGVENVALNQFKVYSSAGVIKINGADGFPVKVYSLDGRIVFQQQSISDNFEIALAHGVYIVNLNGEIYKIIN